MHRQQIKLAAFAVGAFGVFGCSSNSETVTSQRQRNWSEADANAITAAAPEPQKEINAETHFAAGHLLEKQGALMKAIQQYQEALRLDPRHVASLNRVAMLYAKTGNHAEAEEAFRRALEEQPDSPLLHNNLGYEYVQEKRWADAAESFEKAIELKPDFVRAHINLGLTLARMDRFDEALTHFQVGLPEPDAYYNLGLMLRGKQRYHDAVQAFQMALDHNPSFVAARNQIDQIAPRLNQTGQVNPPPQWQALTGADKVEPVERPPSVPPTAKAQTVAMAAEDAPPMTGDRTVAMETAPTAERTPEVAEVPVAAVPLVSAPAVETVEEMPTVPPQALAPADWTMTVPVDDATMAAPLDVVVVTEQAGSTADIVLMPVEIVEEETATPEKDADGEVRAEALTGMPMDAAVRPESEDGVNANDAEACAEVILTPVPELSSLPSDRLLEWAPIERTHFFAYMLGEVDVHRP